MRATKRGFTEFYSSCAARYNYDKKTLVVYAVLAAFDVR